MIISNMQKNNLRKFTVDLYLSVQVSGIHKSVTSSIIYFQNISSPQTETLDPFSNNHFLPYLQPLVTSNQLLSINLYILDISYKWNHTISILLCVAYLPSRVMLSRCIHIVTCFHRSYFMAE